MDSFKKVVNLTLGVNLLKRVWIKYIKNYEYMGLKVNKNKINTNFIYLFK